MFQIPDSADWQLCARFDRGQLRSMAAIIASTADEYRRSHVHADEVFAIAPHIPSPQQQEHCKGNQQGRNNSQGGEYYGVFQFAVHDSGTSVALVEQFGKITVENRPRCTTFKPF